MSEVKAFLKFICGLGLVMPGWWVLTVGRDHAMRDPSVAIGMAYATIGFAGVAIGYMLAKQYWWGK